MRIIDTGIDEFDSARRRGRARSAEMAELIATIEALNPNDAKALVISDAKLARRYRSRLLYAARIADKRVQIAESEGKLIFALDPRPRKRRRS